MADEIITRQQLVDASVDAESLQKFISGPDFEDVLTRLGQIYPTLAKLVRMLMETGGWKAYETEAILLATTPLVNPSVGYAFDSKKLYLWNGTSWIDEGLSPLDRANGYTDEKALVTANKVGKTISQVLIKRESDNLYNPMTVTDWPTNPTTYVVSDFIAVEAGKKYKRVNVAQVYRVEAYDSNKQPVVVNGTSTYWQTSEGVTFENIAIPANVAFVRLILPPLSYEKAGFFRSDKNTFIGLDLNTTNLNIGSESLSTFIDRINALFEISPNTFNKKTVTDWPTNPTTYVVSDFIAVEAGKKYKRVNVAQVYRVEAYDSNKQPVVVNGTSTYWQTSEGVTFENIAIPANVAFVRLILAKTIDLSLVMFTESSVDTSIYIPFGLIFKQNQNSLSAIQVSQHYEVGDLGFIDNQLFDTNLSHLIFYGQSLSMGWEADRALTTTVIPGTFMIGDRVWINQGNNGASVLTPLVASKSTSCGESPAVAATQVFRCFLDKYVPHNNVELIATNCGEGGKSIERLSKESTNGVNYYNTLFMTTINRAKAIADAVSKTISCPAIIWMQGEYNYTNLTGEGLNSGQNATNNKDQYKQYLLTLKNNMQADIMSVYGQTKIPIFFMYQVGGGYINLDTMTINEAMTEFESENDDVVFMNPTYQVPDYNGGHLSSNGYRWYGEYIAKQLKTTLLEHKSSDVVQMRNVKVIDRNKILIECQVNHPPLVVDTYTTQARTSNGFKVADSSGEISVIAFKILNGSAILLTLSREIGANAFITYAGKDRSGSGNIRDSHRYASKFTYVSDTGFVSPTYTPLDKNGVVLDGKKLPLKNWLVAFYAPLN
ncbi:sialate O-acetylesterase [Acinetobacter baumannii]|uniref:sialate O-acetylesterase n=1 Tax=Acinetobacter baumannii TaxID=470 RepID=UPI0036F4885D